MSDPTLHPSMTADCFTWVRQGALPLSSQWLQSLFDSALRDQWYHPGRSKLATRRVCRLETDTLKMENLHFYLHWSLVVNVSLYFWVSCQTLGMRKHSLRSLLLLRSAPPLHTCDLWADRKQTNAQRHPSNSPPLQHPHRLSLIL